MGVDITAELRNAKYISLTTFKRDGTAVPSPVWFSLDQSRIVLFTAASAGKVKRIRNSAKVRVARCTVSGKVTGTQHDGTARLLPASEAARVEALLDRKYGFTKRLFTLFSGLLRLVARIRKRSAGASSARTYIEVTLN